MKNCEIILTHLLFYSNQVIVRHQDTHKGKRLSKIPLLFDKNGRVSTKLTDGLGDLKCKP